MEPASSVTGDDWADEHMAEPAPRLEPEIVEPDVVREEPSFDGPVDAEPVSEPEAGWRVEPTFAADDAETDYARLYERPADEPAQVEAAPSIEPEAPVAAEADPFRDAPTAEENLVTGRRARNLCARLGPAAVCTPCGRGSRFGRRRRFNRQPVLIRRTIHSLPPSVSIRSRTGCRVVHRMLFPPFRRQAGICRSQRRRPPIVSRNCRRSTQRSASISYTPTDEFPAYEEPVRVEPSRDFVAPEGLNLPDADPSVLGPLGVSTSAAAVEPDDFSQWFQDNAEEAKAPTRAGDSAASPQAALAPSEWDEHIDSFSPSAKGAAVETAGPADGMEALVGGYGQQPSYRLEPKKRRNFSLQ